jgi:hypothetical protein
VGRIFESGGFGHLIRPRFDAISFDLNGHSAVPTNQVMVMGVGAGSIEHLAILGLQGIGVAIGR